MGGTGRRHGRPLAVVESGVGQGGGIGVDQRRGHGRHGDGLGRGRERSAVTVFHHVDHHHGDVVAAGARQGRGHQRLGRFQRGDEAGEDAEDVFFRHLVEQAVAAEQEPVAHPCLAEELVDLDVGRDAEGPGEDVALGVVGRLLGGQPLLAYQVFHQAVVVGELLERVPVDHVGPAVAHVDHADLAFGRPQGERHQRGAHAPQVGVGGPFEHGPVGVFHQLDQAAGADGVGDADELGDGDGGRRLSALVAAHAVGHDGHEAAEVAAVLVGLPHVAHMGDGGTEQFHQRSSITIPPRRSWSPKEANCLVVTRWLLR